MFLPGAWRENDRIRRVASAILADAASAEGVRRFIQESFAPVYADGGADWIDERGPVRPARYNQTVLDAERAVARFTERGGAAVVLRFAAFYGPDAVQPRDGISLVRWGWMPLPDPPTAFFSSVSHDDAASAVAAALGVPAGIHNVTDDEPLTRQAYGEAIAGALEVASPKPFPAWLSLLSGSLGKLMSRSQRLSNRKLRAAGGWASRYPSARAGLRAAVSELW